jgi:hypothetical protein
MKKLKYSVVRPENFEMKKKEKNNENFHFWNLKDLAI